MGIGIFFLLFGLFFLVGGIWYRQHGTARHRAASGSWARAEAVILHASTPEVSRTDNQGFSHTGWRPLVGYSFPTPAGEWQGSHPFLHAIPRWARCSQAEAWLARYPAGARVPVWYDPANPADSALELNKPSAQSFVVFMILGVLGAAFGLAMIVKG